ncbi:RagB/SusD family nutrient uptake outer membrane protein [Bacteroides sp.]|uniref:RagB/SusD family nutrient uptake outer membrane protein n=1 Tax=Bacteroides sp. TaxID=29523 RepID=UPI002583E1D5|nr:RagB/SusD family nutrient uptake outer membrane protein [Bacteroides sp.]
MKNIKSKLIGLFSIFIIALMASCTDNFYDYNKEGSDPTDEDIPTPVKLGAFLLQMQEYVVPAQENAYQMSESLIGHVYGRYFATTNEGWGTSFGTFNASEDWLNSPFEDAFSNEYGAWNRIKKLTKESGPYFAWSQVLKIASMHRMTDLYGPIPYSEISKGTGSITVAYDSQEDVYKTMFEEIEIAIDELASFVALYPEDRTMAKFDVVYSGDFSKWVKFANSLKLRMALRIVYVDPVLAKTMAESAVSHPMGVMLKNEDNAALLYNGINPLHIIWNDYTDVRACADIITYMKGYKDPRIAQYFQKGKVSGINDYQGLRVGIDPEKTWALSYSAPVTTKNDRVQWMNASEITFARAEGALRGWSMGGSPKDLYEQAVQLSFEQWSAGDAANYLNDDKSTQAAYDDPKHSTNAVSKITIKWKENASDEEKLERIMTQKWLAMYTLGIEAWSEQRRTGFPRFFSVPIVRNTDASLKTRFASRLPYPISESKNNTVNYTDAVQNLLNGSDNYSTRLWWDKKTNKPGWE